MSIPFFRKSKKEQMVEARHKRAEETIPLLTRLFQTRSIIRASIFLAFCLILILVCFLGQFPSGLQVFPNQIAKIRIVADFPFTYKSQILTKRLEEQLRKQIAPVYHIDNDYLISFQKYLIQLREGIDALELKLQDITTQEKLALIDKFNRDFEQSTGIYISNEDLTLILDKTDTDKRKQIFQEGTIILRDITREGVFEPLEGTALQDDSSPYFYNIQIEGRHTDIHVQSEKDALRQLSLNIGTLDINWPLARAMFRILKHGVKPNLVFNADKSEQKINKAIETAGPARKEVKQGHTIIEPGSTIGPEQLEQLKAYRNLLKDREDFGFGFNITFFERSFLALAILFTCALCVNIGLPNFLSSNRRLALAGLIIIVNLALIRLILELGETTIFTDSPNALATLPFITPTALGPLITAIIIGPRPAILVAVIVSTFFALMLGSGVSFSLVSLLSALIGVYLCRHIRIRAKVIRIGTITGGIVALSVFFIGIINQINIATLGYEILFALLTGTITGFIVIGVLPFLENLFKITTDITLLELTDFNHPLLRRLQMEAPGTYHHSIMVANLSERAAVQIGANPLICRACSLYHDIGKMIKPEYFVENQKSGIDPHKDHSPSMSALIIKSHVKEGVSMAKKFKLPRIVIDVIEQHHGTTLIRFFHDKAIKLSHPPFPITHKEGSHEPDSVDESTFRYDGPRPRFKESAIILLADSLEAASRTLQKASSTNIEELIESIFKEKFEDNQLDECPLTFQEVSRIKESFAFTLLNMLHARIDYPDKDKKISPINDLKSNERPTSYPG